MARKNICKYCKYWGRGESYHDRFDWGKCGNKEVLKFIATSRSMLGSFEGFGCIFFDKTISLKK
jgi:hypothetical protein